MKFFKLFTLSFILSLFMLIEAVAAPYVTYKLSYDNKIYTYTEEAVYLKVNGETLSNLDMPPIIMNGNTLVPAREVFEKVGASVAWKEKEQEVDVLYKNTFVVMHINDTNAVVAGKHVQMSVAPKIINNKTMIPLRFVGEAVGLEVNWDKENRTAIINEIVETTTETTTQAPPIIIETTTITTTETTTEATTISYETLSSGNSNKSTISGILVPSGNSNSFVISGSSILSDVKIYEVKDGKLTMDFMNTENMLHQNSFSVAHPDVTLITASQLEALPIPVTRVVFSINSTAEFETEFSEDKTNVIVTFKQNAIKKISTETENGNDIVKILGSKTPLAQISRSSDNTKIFVDLPYSSLETSLEAISVGNIIDTVTYSQLNLTTVKVTISLKTTEFSYNSITRNNNLIITISKNDGSNNTNNSTKPPMTATQAGYNKENHTIVLPNPAGFNASSVIHTDNYTQKKYTLTFNSDYASVFGNGTVEINDDYINSYTISTENGKTNINISEKKILVYDVTCDNQFIYIKAMLPKEKYKNIVVLDAGHGGTDVGAVGNGLYEKNLTLSIVEKLMALFEKDPDIKAYATRTSDVYPQFRERTDLADEVGDIFISVHINSAGNATAANGTEVYHYNGKSTASGLSSEILANKMQTKLLEHLGSVDRKVKTGDLFVIRETFVPAVLCEIGFISNPTEAAKMGSASYQQQVAQAIYDGCKELFEAFPNR